MNSDKAKAEVELDIGGRVRRLVFSVNAACLVERELGREVLSGSFFKQMGFVEIRALLWGMIKGEEPTVTVEQVGSWMQFPRFGEYIKAIIEAYRRAMPEAEADEKKA